MTECPKDEDIRALGLRPSVEQRLKRLLDDTESPRRSESDESDESWLEPADKPETLLPPSIASYHDVHERPLCGHCHRPHDRGARCRRRGVDALGRVAAVLGKAALYSVAAGLVFFGDGLWQVVGLIIACASWREL